MAGESRSVVVRLSLDTAQAIAASKQFGTEMDRAMTQAERSTQKSRAAMDQLGGTAGKMALVAAAGLGAIVTTTANFDQAMSNVAATGDEARASLDGLREAAIEAGASTAFSATEAAGGIENLLKAGVGAEDVLGGGLAGALDLAAAGGLDVASAAEIAATALTQFKLEGADVPHVADLLAAAAGKAQGDVTDMAMALKQSGLVASQMGISIEETTGTLAAFASAGLLGSDAGTSFRTMLLRLANATPEAQERMDELGIAAYDAEGNFVGMAEVAGQLQTALQNKTQAERDSALATIFGSDAIRAASVLYEQGAAGVDSWTEKVDDAGYAADTAATRMDNLKGDLEEFLGALETALIGAGEGSQGPLRDLTRGATNAVNAFNDLPGPMQSTVTGLLGLVAVTGGAAWFGSKVIRGVADTREALSDLGLTADRTEGSLGRMSRTAGKIAGLAGAVSLLGDAIADATGAKLDTSDLQRDLEAIADGRASEVLDRIVGDLDRLGHTANQTTEPLYELSTGLGLLGDTPMDTASSNIASVDQALASLVESGNADEAAEIFNKIAAALTGLPEGSSFDPAVIDGFDSYATALDNAATASTEAAEAQKGLGPAGKTAAGGLSQSSAAAARAAERMKEARSAARDTAKGFITLGDSLDDGKKSLGEWMRDLEQQASALRDFTSNARTAAKRGLDEGLIKSLNEAGPAGALRMKQLANATDAEIRRANKAWRDGQAAIREYVNMKVPPKEVRVDNKQALSALQRIRAEMATIKDKTVRLTYYVNQVNAGNKHASGGADGDPTTPMATGGPIVGPGTKTSDSVPIMASNGEFMMSAAAVDHYGLDTMFAMNARRLASGGPVDTGTALSRSAGIGTNSQLYGIDKAFLSVAELAERLSKLTVEQLAALGDEIDKLSKKSLVKLSKALEQAAADAKEDLQELRSARSALAESVRELITGGDLFTVSSPAATGGDSWWMNNQGLSREEIAQYRDEHNALVAAGPSVTSNVDSLIRGGEERLQLIRKIRSMGVDGPALANLATQPIEVLRELASSRGDALRFERQYERLQQVGQRAGQYVGSAVYDKRIDQQLDELKGLRADFRDVKQRLGKLEDIKQATEKGADRVVGAIKGEVGNGARRHRG